MSYMGAYLPDTLEKRLRRVEHTSQYSSQTERNARDLRHHMASVHCPILLLGLVLSLALLFTMATIFVTDGP